MIDKNDSKMSLIVFLLVGALIATQYISYKELKRISLKYSGNVGKEILFNADTLKVIDYSMIHETYTLSNGVTVNKKIVEER
jgi:hypothetical protein